MKKRITDKRGYLTFTLIGIFIIIAGVLMNVFNRTASSDIGMKYSPPESSSISGNLVILLGIILLTGIFVFYVVERKRKV